MGPAQVLPNMHLFGLLLCTALLLLRTALLTPLCSPWGHLLPIMWGAHTKGESECRAAAGAAAATAAAAGPSWWFAGRECRAEAQGGAQVQVGANRGGRGRF